MPAEPAITLTTPVGRLPGVGSRRAASFARLGLRCVADLIRHLPSRYEDEQAEQTIAALGHATAERHGTASHLTIRGEVANTRIARGRRTRFMATVEDGTGSVLLTWFNAPWMQGKLHPGMHVLATGRAQRYGEYLQMVNPTWERIDHEEPPAVRDARLRPIYPASEDLTSRVIGQAIEAGLDPALALLDDHLPDDYRARRSLPRLADAYRMIHRPADVDEAVAARRRLAFDELLLLQLGVMLKRRHRRETLSAPVLTHTPQIHRHILARFPFALTEGQEGVVAEIATDLTVATPMNRLLQGDVGSGKTVVALYAMLMAVASNHQAALMAPTELLAEQHLASMSEMLAGSGVTIELLTGSLRAAARRDVLERLEAGAIDILVGTHALLTEHVGFRNLAVTVVDEQHRFGVHQRATLRTKGAAGDVVPHTLVMTATPIPRTMSLTVFGDLDVSTIRDMPPGRQTIVTRHVTTDTAPEVYAYVRSRIDGGEQAYVVVPVIDEAESGLTSVASHLAFLEAGPLAGVHLAALHGRLPPDERDEIMQRFRRGELDALVATTVIEVGVDVANATMMVVEHADRFGLAQLHQLRGRVGRGDRKSLCVLIADPATDEGARRLEALVESTDGFVIAEKDLEIRGPGELFGSRQSGLAPFHAARIPGDLELLRLARRDAVEWINENPTLDGERDALLKRRLLKTHGKALGIGDVG